jgi:hypothetical protein
MARDIFNREVDLGDPLAADATRLLLPLLGEPDMLLQSTTLQYQQNITRLWELGSNKTFFFAGRTQGQISAKRIIGSKNAQLAFVKQFGDVCNMKKNHMTIMMKAGCTDAQDRGKLSASGCVVQSVSYSIVASDMIINEDISILFARLESK